TPMQFTARSLNTGFLAMASQLDLCAINQTAEDMGVQLGRPVQISGADTEDDPSDDVYSRSVTEENVPFNVLGSKNIAPIVMAAAFGTVTNHGVHCTPRVIDTVIGHDGEELPLPEHSCDQVISEPVAATTAYALQGVMAAGGTGSASNPWD